MTRFVLLLALVLVGCRKPADVAPPPAAQPTTEQLTYLTEPFEALYPVFLAGRATPTGEKAGLWTKYRDRWVRWQGVITSFTDNGVTMKQLLLTTTFDVSLICDTHDRALLKSRYSVGDRVEYTGKLDSFDDVFRTLYLTHGSVLEKVPQGDLGVPFDMLRVAAP